MPHLDWVEAVRGVSEVLHGGDLPAIARHHGHQALDRGVFTFTPLHLTGSRGETFQGIPKAFIRKVSMQCKRKSMKSHRVCGASPQHAGLLVPAAEGDGAGAAPALAAAHLGARQVQVVAEEGGQPGLHPHLLPQTHLLAVHPKLNLVCCLHIDRLHFFALISSGLNSSRVLRGAENLCTLQLY